jgi:hypothetical protein
VYQLRHVIQTHTHTHSHVQHTWDKTHTWGRHTRGTHTWADTRGADTHVGQGRPLHLVSAASPFRASAESQCSGNLLFIHVFDRLPRCLHSTGGCLRAGQSNQTHTHTPHTHPTLLLLNAPRYITTCKVPRVTTPCKRMHAHMHSCAHMHTHAHAHMHTHAHISNTHAHTHKAHAHMVFQIFIYHTYNIYNTDIICVV